jgi:hypothetical protein
MAVSIAFVNMLFKKLNFPQNCPFSEIDNGTDINDLQQCFVSAAAEKWHAFLDYMDFSNLCTFPHGEPVGCTLIPPDCSKELDRKLCPVTCIQRLGQN